MMMSTRYIRHYFSTAIIASFVLPISFAWNQQQAAVLSRKISVQYQRSNVSKCRSTSNADYSDVNLFPSTDAPTSPNMNNINRRALFKKVTTQAIGGCLLSSATIAGYSEAASAASAETAVITDRIFLDVKGLPSSQASAESTRRIVIGLFGNDTPESVSKLKQLVSPQGLATPCKPRAERTLQKEQLEANKVYNNCIDNQDKGVNYDYSTIWRVIADERIDVGAVSGKFISREYPIWEEKPSPSSNNLKHDTPGVISVRRGNEGGFGFMIYPGKGKGGGNTNLLDSENIVIGRVIEGMDIVQEINDIPVITSSKVNYMGLTGGPTTKAAPNRSCQYGGAMYCNENKPLVKLSIFKTGVL